MKGKSIIVLSIMMLFTAVLSIVSGYPDAYIRYSFDDNESDYPIVYDYMNGRDGYFFADVMGITGLLGYPGISNEAGLTYPFLSGSNSNSFAMNVTKSETDVDYTLSFFMRINTTTTDMNGLFGCADVTSNGYGFYMNTDRLLRLFYNANTIPTTEYIDEGDWNMFTLVYDYVNSGSSLIDLYLNGSLIFSYDTEGERCTYDYMTIGNLWYVGYYSETGVDAFIDEAYFFDSLLSPAEISELYDLYNVTPCVPDWQCSGYSSICNISGLASCDSVTDSASCDVSYTGDYSEFAPASCDFCTDRLFLNESFSDSDYESRGWFNSSQSGGEVEIIDGYYHAKVTIGATRLSINLSDLNMSDDWKVTIRYHTNTTDTSFPSEWRMGYQTLPMEAFVVSNNGVNVTHIGNSLGSCSGNFSDFSEFYIADIDTLPHVVDYIKTGNEIRLYHDGEYKLTMDSYCSPVDVFRLSSRDVRQVYDYVAVCGRNETLPCVPDWQCDGYSETCNISDLAVCDSVSDAESCGEPYTGDYSEFAPEMCDYCIPEVMLSSGACIGGSRISWINNTNYTSCCLVTNLSTDCIISGYDARDYDGNISYSEPCTEPTEPPVTFSIDLTLLIVTGLLSAIFIVGLAVNIPLLVFFSGLGFFVVGVSPLITLFVVKLIYALFGIVLMYIFGMLLMSDSR